MALTINTTPANISNSGAWNVTTSLVEDATHVNLRIRADVKVSAVTKATAEKPKGLPDFDFFDILKTLVPGLSFARNGGALYNVSGGSPLIAYTVTFTEVWEDAGGSTQTGTPTNSGTKSFVPAKGDGTAFTNYVGTGTGSKFACLTLPAGACKFYSSNPSEMWIVFFTESTSLELFYSKDGGAYDHATHITASAGWVVLILNPTGSGMMNGVTSNLRIQMGILGGAKISEVITILVDNTVMDHREVLEFDGLIGGKEYLAFEGMKHKQFDTVRNYISGAKLNRKPLSFTGIQRQSLATRYPDIYNADQLKALLISETVKKMEPSYATPTDVTVTTEGIKTASSDLFTNQIDIEYEY